MAEFWGWCAACERSFYLGAAGDGAKPANATCPVCMTPPAEIEVTALQD